MRTYLLILAMLASPAALAEMWKCVDKDGYTRYTNVRSESKGCAPLNLEPINTAPAPAASSSRPQQKAPANFPSVDGETQKQRDVGRRKILEQELSQEQQLLEGARKQLAEQKDVRLGTERNFARVEERLKPFQDKVRLHENNVESLKKEISNIR